MENGGGIADNSLCVFQLMKKMLSKITALADKAVGMFPFVITEWRIASAYMYKD